MGYGSWDHEDFKSYVNTSLKSSKGLGGSVSLSKSGRIEYSCDVSSSQVYTATAASPDMLPLGVVRECRDSEDHLNTLPVILALDVTGSMSDILMEVSASIGSIMNHILSSDLNKNVEFLICGFGDIMFDKHPLQVSQFESDVRIADWLSKIYFEQGGGNNPYESYSLVWFFASHQTDLDCWKRGEKGIIITIGDEELDPSLPKDKVESLTGIKVQSNLTAKSLYDKVSKYYDIYHIDIDKGHYRYYNSVDNIKDSWTEVINPQHYFNVKVDKIEDIIANIITQKSDSSENCTVEDIHTGNTDGISW